jgi:hypothetical protein
MIRIFVDIVVDPPDVYSNANAEILCRAFSNLKDYFIILKAKS